ncbi:hypothetical protein [Streptomyces sp. NPDC055134]
MGLKEVPGAGPAPELRARLLLQERQLMFLSTVREGGGAAPYLSSGPAPRPPLTRRVSVG